MTVIIFRKSKQGEYKGFYCKGHAGYSESGSDIVCASISMLVINTINALETLCHTSMNVEDDADDGIIRCEFKSQLDERESILVETLEFGLRNVEKEYGKKYCKVKFEEV